MNIFVEDAFFIVHNVALLRGVIIFTARSILLYCEEYSSLLRGDILYCCEEYSFLGKHHCCSSSRTDILSYLDCSNSSSDATRELFVVEFLRQMALITLRQFLGNRTSHV